MDLKNHDRPTWCILVNYGYRCYAISAAHEAALFRVAFLALAEQEAFNIPDLTTLTTHQRF